MNPYKTGGTDRPLPPMFPMRCCRTWPLVMGYRIGRCGICNTIPTEVVDEHAPN